MVAEATMFHVEHTPQGAGGAGSRQAGRQGGRRQLAGRGGGWSPKRKGFSEVAANAAGERARGRQGGSRRPALPAA